MSVTFTSTAGHLRVNYTKMFRQIASVVHNDNIFRINI